MHFYPQELYKIKANSNAPLFKIWRLLLLISCRLKIFSAFNCYSWLLMMWLSSTVPEIYSRYSVNVCWVGSLALGTVFWFWPFSLTTVNFHIVISYLFVYLNNRKKTIYRFYFQTIEFSEQIEHIIKIGQISDSFQLICDNELIIWLNWPLQRGSHWTAPISKTPKGTL